MPADQLEGQPPAGRISRTNRRIIDLFSVLARGFVVVIVVVWPNHFRHGALRASRAKKCFAQLAETRIETK